MTRGLLEGPSGVRGCSVGYLRRFAAAAAAGGRYDPLTPNNPSFAQLPPLARKHLILLIVITIIIIRG